MKQFTFSAQVANNLLTVLQGYTKGIRFVAVLLVLFTVNIGTASAEKSIDFESGTATYSDWTFTNMTSQQSGSIDAYGGSYYGTTGGKSTASIQTKNQISSPKSISCYVSKQTTNTTSSTWYIQTSTNGSSWTNVKTQSATSMSKGSWVEFTADLSSDSSVYVRIYYSGSTAVRNIDNLVLTEGTTTSYDVNWMVNGANYTTGSPTTSVLEGSKVTILPTAPSLDCSGKTFVGWSNQEVTDGNKPSVLFTTAENSPAINANTTFYAVFATATGGGDTPKQYSFDITPSDFNTTSYAANNNEKTSTATAIDGSGSTVSVKWTSYQVMKQSSNMQWQKSAGYIYNSTDLGTINSVTVTSSTGTFTTYYGTTSQPSSGTEGDGKGYFKTSVGSATGQTTKVEVVFTKSSGSAPTYSDYTTECTTETLPSLSASVSSLAFGGVTVNSSEELEFTLTGSNLTANATLALSGTNESMFSVNPTSVTQSAGTINQTDITVTYTPTAAGEHTATLTISSTGAESKTVTLSGTGVAPAAKYTVTFDAGSGSCSTTSLQETSSGAGVTLPTANPPATCATDGWEFAGWWTEAVTETTTSPGELLTEDSNYKPASDCTLYAVYSYTEAGGGGSTSYVLTAANAVTAGTYVIGITGSSGYYIATGLTGSTNVDMAVNTLTDVTLTNNAFTTLPTGGMELTFTGNNTDGFTISNSGGDKLSYSSYTSRRLSFDATGKTWKVIEDNSKLVLQSHNSDGYYTISQNGTNSIRGYASDTKYNTLYLFKKTGGSTTTYNSNPVCVASWSITYDFKGGTGSHCSNTSVPQGDPYTICDEEPTKEGHTFQGWSDGTTTHDAGATFTPTDDVTLTAVWEANTYTVTWNVSGKTNTGLGPRSVTKNSAIGTLPVPEVPAACVGKTFMGWTESNIVPSDGKGIVYITEATVPSKNTTYYAVFATINNFCTQKPIDQIASGSKVVIVAVASLTDDGGAGKAISSRATDDTYNLQGDDVAIYDQTINTPHSTCIWTITKSGEKYIFTQDGNYLNGIIDGGYSNLKYNGTSDSWSLSNAASGMAMTYNMKSTNASTEYVEWYNGKFTIHDEVNANGDFDMQFYVTANEDGNADITDYTTGCAEYTITYYGFHGGYSTSCSSDGTIVLPVNSIHTIPDCEGLVINDHTNLGREFLNVWMTQPHGGHTFKPGDTFILTQDTTLYAQWKMETTSDVTTLPTDIEDLAGTDIYVYGGTTLNIQPGTTTINSLTLKGGLQADGSYKMPTVWVPEGATLVRNSNKINLDLIVNAKTWYPFAVPFAAKNNANVEYLDPVLAAASYYGTHFAIKTYDGARRAEVGEDKANNWVRVLRDSTLQPGVGYIITALTYPDKDTATIRIPMTVPNTWFKNGEQAAVNTTVRNTIAVTAHAGEAATEHQRHAGWNFVANPYLTSFAGGNVANDGGLAYINGELIIEGSYEYTDEEVPYVTVPAYNFAYYDQVKLSEVKLSPEWSFFVQVGTGGTMNFTTAGRQQAPASIAARNAEERPVKMDVDLILSDNHNSDQTGLIICDRYSDAYEIGRDLEKLFGSAYNLSVYTLMEDNTPLAFQALAIRSSMQVIPVGYRAPEQGEYTFRLNEATSSIDLLNEQYEQLVLVDYQTGELTNLLYTDYTFYSERTQSNSRFAIYAVPRQNAPTDLPNAIGSDEEVRKVIYNDHLYILRDGNVYNGMGQKM